MEHIFDLETYMRESGKGASAGEPGGEADPRLREGAFDGICKAVRAAFDSDWRTADEGSRDRRLEREGLRAADRSCGKGREDIKTNRRPGMIPGRRVFIQV